VPICVNLQGDEPELDPRHIDQLVATLRSAAEADMATLATPITVRRDLEDPACTKVVCDARGRALYFSRCPIPFVRDGDLDQLLSADSPWLLHLGVYAFRTPFLLELAAAPPSRLEQFEKLEQLRALEMGTTLMVSQVEQAAVGIDTAADYAAFVARQQTS
jgi:3-deoxy-manno-octulosonate cytidylyltransferase (CMP-KDO synthetase)